jgi:ATP-dependent DNA helicase RecQ
LHSGSLALKIAPVFFSGRWGQRGAGGSIESNIAGKAGFTGNLRLPAVSPGQETIIDTALGGRDCLVVMPTGGGKSLCYQVPALVLGGLTVVVSPLISLMKDQVDQLLANGVAAACLNSTQSREQQQEVMAGCRSGQIRLLYIAPERLMLDNFLEHLSHWNLAMVAVDEAHCISQWGHDFRRNMPPGPAAPAVPQIPFMALTATADDTTRRDIVRLLGLNDPLIQVSSFDRPNIRYMLMEKFKPLDQLMRYVQDQRGKSGIIYCNSRSKVEDTAASAKPRHQRGGLSCRAGERRSCGRAGEIPARRSANRGGHGRFRHGDQQTQRPLCGAFDIPRNIESYYQETGRAGRDGLPAEAMLFYDPADMAWLRRCLEEKPAGPLQDIERHKLNAMGAFAEAQTCRRLVLLNYFGEGRQERAATAISASIRRNSTTA